MDTQQKKPAMTPIYFYGRERQRLEQMRERMIRDLEKSVNTELHKESLKI